jgi:hypothetical protein
MKEGRNKVVKIWTKENESIVKVREINRKCENQFSAEGRLVLLLYTVERMRCSLSTDKEMIPAINAKDEHAHDSG